MFGFLSGLFGKKDKKPQKPQVVVHGEIGHPGDPLGWSTRKPVPRNKTFHPGDPPSRNP
ncbi:MAG: hypothetical protein HZC02_00435 [Candidatus Levybacteria bacterium]|nr:hypothetical protein [Candidatus Levybacteria bacterium]